MKKDITLVILAAGMGSRYGGLKQIEPVGPNGEFIIDYSIYDAIKSGFNKVVFIIKRENEQIFKRTIGSRIERHIKVEYAFQDMDELPNGFKCPSDRTKPWGTVHALLAAKDVVSEPFAIINADDFYGRDAYKTAADYLLEGNREPALVGYKLTNTLSPHGSVKRGICEIDDENLIGFVESKVVRIGNDIEAIPLDPNIEPFNVKETSIVAMNMFCFLPDIFNVFEQKFINYLNNSDLNNCEYILTEALTEAINKDNMRIKTLNTDANWFGVTYKEDKEEVMKKVEALIEMGSYERKLWK